MQIANMPLFDMFLPIFQTKTIENWTANDFWKHIKLTKKERTRFNRQRMYRVLRKLVENGYLTKIIDPLNIRNSSFSETQNIKLLRQNNNLINENIAIENKIFHIEENIKKLGKKKEALKMAEAEFPNLSHKVNSLKDDLINEINQLKLYKDVLQTLKN